MCETNIENQPSTKVFIFNKKNYTHSKDETK